MKLIKKYHFQKAFLAQILWWSKNRLLNEGQIFKINKEVNLHYLFLQIKIIKMLSKKFRISLEPGKTLYGYGLKILSKIKGIEGVDLAGGSMFNKTF